MKIKEKTLEIPEELMEEEWMTNKVVITRLKAKDQGAIADMSAAARLNNQGVTGTISMGTAKAATVLKCVKEAPWKVNDPASIGELDGVFYDWLFHQITEFNSFTEKKKMTSSGTSTQTGGQTPSGT